MIDYDSFEVWGRALTCLEITEDITQHIVEALGTCEQMTSVGYHLNKAKEEMRKVPLKYFNKNDKVTDSDALEDSSSCECGDTL